MPVFEKRSRIAAPPEAVYAFHARPDALDLLMPPGERTRVIERSGGLGVGARGPFARWVTRRQCEGERGAQ